MRLLLETRLAARRITADWIESGLIVVSVAIGLAFVVSTGSVLRGLLLKPPPYYVDADALVTVGQAHSSEPALAPRPVTWGLFETWNGLDRWHGRTAASRPPVQTAVRIGNAVRTIQVQRITPDLFRVLGVRAVAGREFEESDRGGPAVSMVSAAFWDREFGTRPAPSGEVILLNGQPTRIVGVLPERFWFLAPGTQVWLPLVPPSVFEDGAAEDIVVVARLPQGVSPQQAAQEFEASARVHRRRSGTAPDSAKVVCEAILGRNRASGAGGFVLLFVFSSLILATACANAALLFLSRWDRRATEAAVRIALGATRQAVLRSSLIEALLLVGAGWTSGTLLGACGVAVLLDRGPVAIKSFAIGTDALVLAAAAGVLGLAWIAVGVWPSLALGRMRPADALREDRGIDAPGGPRHRIDSVLVSAQIAFAFMAVFLAATLVSAYRALSTKDIGLDPAPVVAFTLIPDHGATRAVGPDRIASEVDQLAAVESVAYSAHPILRDAGHLEQVIRPRFAAVPERNRISVQRVSPAYFATVGARFEKGRDFVPSETRDVRPGAVIVNRSAAHALWPGQDPVGKELALESGRTVVAGVVGDIVNAGLFVPTRPCVFVPFGRSSFADMAQPTSWPFVAKASRAAAETLVAEIRAAVATADPGAGIQRIETLSRRIDRMAEELLLGAYLLGPLLLVAMFLVFVGLVGLLNSFCQRSRREFGIRMAVGASAANLYASVLAKWAALLGLGLLAGGVASWALAQVLEGTVAVFAESGWPVYAASAALVGLGTVPAVTFPLQWISSLGPLDALRG